MSLAEHGTNLSIKKSNCQLAIRGACVMTSRKIGTLTFDECEDITGKPTPKNPAHRPSDKLWLRHVGLAWRVDQQIKDRDADGRKKPSNCSIAEGVAEANHVSLPTVQRAYSYYILEPQDPNGAPNRNWKNRKGSGK